MWTRRTWHECADELAAVSERFRAAYWERCSGEGRSRGPLDEAEMRNTSIQGVEVLRALALAIRSEQDFEMVGGRDTVVGVLKARGAVSADVSDVKQGGGYAAMIDKDGYQPLTLRGALNKVAHADPRRSDYYVAPMDRAHDLLLFGELRGEAWFAAISVLELVKAIHSLPNRSMPQA